MLEPQEQTHHYRLRLAKGWGVRLISHLDLLRTIENTLRRTGLPVAHSQGFHPKQKISYGAPLPLGFTSQAEWMDLTLTEEADPGEAMRVVNAAVPAGLRVFEARALAPEERKKSLAQIERKAEYYCFVNFAPGWSLDRLLEVSADKGWGAQAETMEGEEWKETLREPVALPAAIEALGRFESVFRAFFQVSAPPVRPDRWVESLGGPEKATARMHCHRARFFDESGAPL